MIFRQRVKERGHQTLDAGGGHVHSNRGRKARSTYHPHALLPRLQVSRANDTRLGNGRILLCTPQKIPYSAIASVSTLIFIPSTSLKTEAQATVVAPVVKTSSTIRTCLFVKSAG